MYTAVDPGGLDGLGAELAETAYELSRRACAVDDALRSAGLSSCSASPLRAVAEELRDVHGIVRRRVAAAEEADRARTEKRGGLSGWVHGALDVVGLVPVLGEAADGVNALWYLAEGDLANAALSGAALLPVGGQAATASRYVDDALEMADDAVRVADDGVTALKGTWGRSDTFADHAQRHGPDFGVSTPEEYELLASEFLISSQQRGLPTKIDSGGRIRIYDRETNTFGSYNPDGSTATFYKLDATEYGYTSNWEYWQSQKGTPPWKP